VKQVMLKQGQVVVEDIPAPLIESGMVLVQVDHSCISAGTEISGMRNSGAPLWQRALRNPAKIRRVAQLVAEKGLGSTRVLVASKTTSATIGISTGYSAAGTILEIGDDIVDLAPGDRVACAGAQYAHHAEIIAVPRNLVVPVPDTLDLSLASTVTLGAIALQGVRRAQPTLGETFVVIGLGILGQLTAQLLRVNGCRVIGLDLVRARIAMAQQLGMAMGVHPDDGSDIEQVSRLTEGIGADGVIITAATTSDAVISTAFQMCRKKGRVVLVGAVGLNLNREDFYAKEIDFFISTSYGPGRYDRRYEEDGLDYPVGYVRWTENRNMIEYMRLLNENRLKITPLIGQVHPVDNAPLAYSDLESGETRPLIVLLSYPLNKEAKNRRVVPNPLAQALPSGKIRLAIIGAGDFAREVHLPNLKLLANQYFLHTIVNRNGDKAASAARQFGAAQASTDYQAVLDNPEIDAVLIATRHDHHTSLVMAALKAGKHVFVEKPLALTSDELDEITAFYAMESAKQPVLLTGFNRRFSPYAQRIHELTTSRENPMIISYRMNAGYIPLDHWVHSAEGGGRNRGEACHIYDLFTYLTGSQVFSVEAKTIKPTKHYYSARDNFVVTLTFEDGSLATLLYTALGSRDYPKEYLEIYIDGKVIVMDDYKKLTVTGAKVKGLETSIADKGHKPELEAFAQTIRSGGEWPIPLWQQVQATTIALRVEAQLGGS
jgi:predicted dehydrogenase/threonine dehydrogenase-like Zn-dependent dehydrogenase